MNIDQLPYVDIGKELYDGFEIPPANDNDNRVSLEVDISGGFLAPAEFPDGPTSCIGLRTPHLENAIRSTPNLPSQTTKLIAAKQNLAALLEVPYLLKCFSTAIEESLEGKENLTSSSQKSGQKK